MPLDIALREIGNNAGLFPSEHMKSTVSVSVSTEPVFAAHLVSEHARKAVSTVAQSATRLESIDLYRGLVMVIMLLDHVREWVHRDGMAIDPLALASTTPLLYFSRWITHLCAPAFVLLAGLGVGLQRQRGATIPELTRFLWTRGLVLIFIEVVPIRLIVQTNFASNFLANLQVIWVIGLSMIALAALIHLPKRAILAVGLVIVGGHNLLDGIKVPAWTGPNAAAPDVVCQVVDHSASGRIFPDWRVGHNQL